MITIYIKEWEREDIFNIAIPKFIKNIMFKIIKNANIILSKRIENNSNIYFIPNIYDKKVYNKVRKKVEKEVSTTQKVQIVLSNKMKQYKEEFKKFKLLEGKKMFQELAEPVLNEVLQDDLLAMQDIYILTNKYCENSTCLIKQLSSKVKSINIITKEIEKYLFLEEMLSNLGIAVCVANNKKKSLKKAKIIINIDFNESELNKYTIYRNSVIINLNSEKMTKLKSFDGIIVQDIQMELEEKEEKFIQENCLDKNFRKLEIYESLKNKIDTKKIKISNLYGNNGEIDKKELRNMQKILTNVKN